MRTEKTKKNLHTFGLEMFCFKLCLRMLVANFSVDMFCSNLCVCMLVANFCADMLCSNLCVRMLVGSFGVDVFLVVCGFVVCKCATSMYVRLK